MHPGSIYAAFGNKAKLYCRAMDRYVEWVSKARDHAEADAYGILDGLANLIERAHPISNEEVPLPACFLVKKTLEIGADHAEIQSRLAELLETNDRLFEAKFQAAIDSGELTSNQTAGELSAQLHAALAGLCFHALRTPDREFGRKMARKLANQIRNAGQGDRLYEGVFG